MCGRDENTSPVRSRWVSTSSQADGESSGKKHPYVPTASAASIGVNSPRARRHRPRHEPFPREQLWKWSRPTQETSPPKVDHDVIEKVLRECATSTFTAPTTTATLAGPSTTAIPVPERRLQLSRVSSLPSSPPVSSSPPPGSASSSSQPTPQLPTGGSRLKLAKNETHSTFRTSSRNLGTPSSDGKEGDGWKAYRLAHRTNRLIAKTRKALEGGGSRENVIATPNSTSQQDELAMSDGEDESKEGLARDLAGPASDDEQRLEEKALSLALQAFRQEVCDDDRQKDSETRPSSRLDGQRTSQLGGSDEFWEIYKGTATNKRPNSARGRYIAHCEESSLLVLPVLDLKRPSRYNEEAKALRYDNYYFGDRHAEALGDAIQLLPVQIKNLSMKNVGISGTGSSAIVNGLALRHVQHLNFSENRIGSRGITTILKGLQDPHVNLRTLDLGNNKLGDQAVKTLLQCLVNRCTLESLDLRKNNIYHAAKAVGELLRITTPLQKLNLSWNKIRGEPAQYLTKCMMENITLTSLDLSDNTLGNNGNADAELGSCLASNKSLKYLNVSNNHIHGRSILVYVDGLQHNSVLETLVIRGNPIGTLGTEAILRAVSSGTIARCEIDVGECNVEILDPSQQTMLYGGGVYNLSLAERGDAVLLKELLFLSWTNKVEITEATLNGNPYTFNRRDEKTYLNTVPSIGSMCVRVQPNYDRREDMIPLHGFNRIVRLLERSFGECRDGDEAAKLFCIRTLAEEYAFTVDQANSLLALFTSHTAQVEKASSAAALIPQICSAKGSLCLQDEVYDCEAMTIPEEFFEDKDKDGKIDVCGDICMVIGLENLSDVEQAHVEMRVGKWISFNVANPTGRYRLNMSNHVDRRIMMRIMETNRLGKRLRQHYKLMDTSQHGLTQQSFQGGFRNVRLNHIPVVMGPGWQFPRVGILEFDFVQTKRPYTICTALSDAGFDKFLREFKRLDVNAETKLIGLRSISSSYYFNCSQVQRVMEQFGTFERDPETGLLFRAEAFIILFARIVDEWNFVETLALLDLATKQQVMDRLGVLHVFHPLQPSESYPHLQLNAFDHRQLILLLVKLATSNEIELNNVILNNQSIVEPTEWKMWTGDDTLPPQGVLSCSMRAINGLQTEVQLPLASLRKKLLKTLMLKLENRGQEQIS
ncbi:hypothetical protein Poli38472_003863 [Pythium oligandrum]|uniref:Uncharacterized protein n=1 Tax=Pythium oligandrum TaxID=41045 RepID=A0A8K1CPM6_PYTOL|nr:hypothetical protein Poli38472_003863 [Pythium oligandrum]|eukprot:TMW66098.1 hypothetical protein Poli38472_003863 [Pythium oligandrum]